MDNHSTIRPILVTGTQRSGSTWVGEMINYSHKINLHTEPFSPLNTWDGMDIFIDDWFHYITEEEGIKYQQEILHALGVEYKFHNLLKKFDSNKTLRGKIGAIKRYLFFPFEKTFGYRPLIKDPMAFFSAEWIYKYLQADIIVLIRHPAAFVSSIKRMNLDTPGWGLDFIKDLTTQKELVEKYLKPYYFQLNNLANKEVDVIEGSILLWNVFHSVILEYQKKYGDVWHFYRHKDLSLNPIKSFEEIYNKLGLKYSDAIKNKIMQSTGDDNPSESINNALHTLKRNSRANVYNWRKRLNNDEIQKIYEGTLKVSSHFYKDDEW